MEPFVKESDLLDFMKKSNQIETYQPKHYIDDSIGGFGGLNHHFAQIYKEINTQKIHDFLKKTIGWEVNEDLVLYFSKGYKNIIMNDMDILSTNFVDAHIYTNRNFYFILNFRIIRQQINEFKVYEYSYNPYIDTIIPNSGNHMHNIEFITMNNEHIIINNSDLYIDISKYENYIKNRNLIREKIKKSQIYYHPIILGNYLLENGWIDFLHNYQSQQAEIQSQQEKIQDQQVEIQSQQEKIQDQQVEIQSQQEKISTLVDIFNLWVG